MNLTYSLITADRDFNENLHPHPQVVMKELGITYQHATPQSLYDCWWFWNCTNVPAVLPPYLTELKIKPHDAIGNGLSKEDADRIAGGK